MKDRVSHGFLFAAALAGVAQNLGCGGDVGTRGRALSPMSIRSMRPRKHVSTQFESWHMATKRSAEPSANRKIDGEGPVIAERFRFDCVRCASAPPIKTSVLSRWIHQAGVALWICLEAGPLIGPLTIFGSCNRLRGPCERRSYSWRLPKSRR
ncbi:hypothetical protein IWX90DRAFT_214130 [Phyllosticta citrichinensis]|uniref:Secreted protein n=1 Tax=Phyllosticta citrichinensis TaxID=1130410 RepID=A0ABR1XTD9_9PEZI